MQGHQASIAELQFTHEAKAYIRTELRNCNIERNLEVERNQFLQKIVVREKSVADISLVISKYDPGLPKKVRHTMKKGLKT